jgi:hypothetical protein
VLQGLTRGYRNHPQLYRFKIYEKPLDLIDAYLYQVYLEASRRGYKFDISKIKVIELIGVTSVTRGQLIYEYKHLLGKLEKRDKKWLEKIRTIRPEELLANPVFNVVEGGVEEWEKRAWIYPLK